MRLNSSTQGPTIFPSSLMVCVLSPFWTVILSILAYSRCLGDDLGEADHMPKVTARTPEEPIYLKRGDLYSLKAGIVELLQWRDQVMTRRDFVSGLNVVPPHDT